MSGLKLVCNLMSPLLDKISEEHIQILYTLEKKRKPRNLDLAAWQRRLQFKEIPKISKKYCAKS